MAPGREWAVGVVEDAEYTDAVLHLMKVIHW